MSTVTGELAEVITRRTFDSLPSSAVHEAKRLVLDFLACAFGGCQQESGRIASEFAIEMAGPAEATVLGRSGKVSALHAAFANAISSHSMELDDVDEEALFHHGPPIVSTALAMAERGHTSGKVFLTSIIAGGETMARLSRATNPALRDRGFHTTPTCGAFGAAVTAGVLLGLTPEQLVSALGLAGAQAAGLMEMYGTSMQKRFNPGPAARSGVTAAVLAQAGFTGADSIIEGERGFAPSFAGVFDRDRFVEGLGVEIPFTVEYKPYSCARPIHNAIDAMLELRERGLRAEQVETVTVYRHPAWATYHRINRPRSFHEAQVSLPYSIAVALVEGKALPVQYLSVGHGDDLAMSISERVRIEEQPGLLRGVSCRLVVRTTSGEELEAVVDYPSGSVQRPLDDSALTAKFKDLAVATLDVSLAEQIAEAVSNLESVTDVNDFTALFAAPSEVPK